MPGEGSVSITIAAAKNGAAIGRSYSYTLDMTGTHFMEQVQTCSSGGWSGIFQPTVDIQAVSITNLEQTDMTNYIKVALDSAGTQVFARIYPGCSMLFNPDKKTGTFCYLRPANTDADVELVLVQV